MDAPGFDYLQIEPTTRCNFTCGFCCGRSMTQSDLSFERFEQMLRAFPSLRAIELQGEGEPLIHPRFFDMVELARQRAIEVSFITNGSFFSRDNVQAILDRDNVVSVTISMESARPSLFQEIRGGKLEKVVAGLELLVATRRERGLKRPTVGLALTILQKTKGELGGVLELYRRLGLDGGITVQLLQAMPCYTACYDEAMKGQLFSAEEARELNAALRDGGDAAPLARINAAKARVGFYDRLWEGWSPASLQCPFLEKSGYIDRDGFVTGCCMIKDVDRFAFGRIGQSSEAELRTARDGYRAALASGQAPPGCRGCVVAEEVAEAYQKQQAGRLAQPAEGAKLDR